MDLTLNLNWIKHLQVCLKKATTNDRNPKCKSLAVAQWTVKYQLTLIEASY